MSASTEVEAAVRVLIGTHTQAQDAGRTDDIVNLYASDAVLEMPGADPIAGHDALREAFKSWAPTQPQLHLVGNTVVTVAGDDRATAVSDVAFIQRGEAGWAVQVVGQYRDTLHRTGEGWRFARRVTAFQA